MISVPQDFARERAEQSGAEGIRWIDEVPNVVARFAEEWNLHLADEVPLWGANALVVLCVRGAEPCALKVGWDRAVMATEAVALDAWGGHGAVQLLVSRPDEGVLLLERLDPSRTLDALDLTQAAGVVGSLIRQLAIPVPVGFEDSRGWADLAGHLTREQSALGSPLPQEWVDLAASLAADLIASADRILLHTDLHSGNVLEGRGGDWLAIDPRAAVGDPERSTPDLLLWRLPLDARPHEVHEALGAMAAAGRLREERVGQWAIVRAVGHWLWCVAADGPDDTEGCAVCGPRCSRILEALA